MKKNDSARTPVPELLREAYPNLSPEEQEEAGENLKRYLNACLRIWERLEREGKNPWADDSPDP